MDETGSLILWCCDEGNEIGVQWVFQWAWMIDDVMVMLWRPEGIPECCVVDVSILIVLEEDCITIL